MKHAHIAVPVAPWDIPDPAGDAWDSIPPEPAIAAARVDKPVRKPVAKPPEAPAARLIARTFMGRLNVSDLDYMAKAILQMADENHELRERVRRLEERLGL